MDEQTSVLYQLMATIKDRGKNPSAESYTSALMAGGVEEIGQKVVEEANEVLEAARNGSANERRGNLVHESADLVYHLFVLLEFCDVELDDVVNELARRRGFSGFEEKARRDGRLPE